MRKIFALAAILFFFAQPVHAQHHWIWSGDDIEVYVEDTTVDVSDDRKEFSITVIDYLKGQKNFHLSRFEFYRQDENWFYSITGKGIVAPVSKTNSSGYILDFVKEKFLSAKVAEE